MISYVGSKKVILKEMENRSMVPAEDIEQRVKYQLFKMNMF
jgi:hypothetical protein